MSNTDPITFDPNLTIPLGLKYADYEQRDSVEEDVVDAEVEVEYLDDGSDTSEEDTTDDEGLDTPSFMTIVSQTIRTAPDGSQVVDVVLDIEDIIGAVKYDVRVTN